MAPAGRRYQSKPASRGIPRIVCRKRRLVDEATLEAADRITLDASFTGDLGADSLALMDLTLAIVEAKNSFHSPCVNRPRMKVRERIFPRLESSTNLARSSP